MIFHKRIFLGAIKINRFLKEERFAKLIINYEKTDCITI
jgi:hypothetical protein